MKLHNEKEYFRELIAASSQHFGLTEFQVEKDYFVSLLLKKLKDIPDVPIVFKGGTSLSKCYGVIDRFSEDIDIAIHFEGEKADRHLRKELKDGVLSAIKDAGLNLMNEEEIRSKRNFNKYVISYPNTYENEDYMLPDIIIESLVSMNPFPCEHRSVSNYITKFLETEISDGQSILKRFELIPFGMSIQTIDRTFIDKLFAVCDYHIEGKYDRYSRHIYDVHMIWQSGLLTRNISSLVEAVINERQLHGFKCFSCEPGRKPNAILQEIINQDAYKTDYNNVTFHFLYNPVKYEECIETLQNIINTKILPVTIHEFK